MEVTFCGTDSIPVVLNFAEVIQMLKHTHINLHIISVCKLFNAFKVEYYDENEIEFPICY